MLETLLMSGLIAASTMLVDEPAQPAGAATGQADLVKACKAVTDAGSYSFTIVTESEGGGFGGPGGGRGGPGGGRGGRGSGEGRGAPAQDATPIQGEYKKSLPIHLTCGDLEVYRLSDQIVQKNDDGEWELAPAPGRRRGDGFGRRGGADDEGGGDDGGARRRRQPEGEGGDDGQGRRRGGRGDYGGMMAMMSLRSAVIPHEALADIAGKITDIQRTESSGTVVWTAKLTPQGARALSGSGTSGRSRGGDNAPETTGDIQFTVGSSGMLDQIVINTSSVFFFGDREVERKRSTTIKLDGLNKTSLTVPEAAMGQFKL